VPDALAPHLGEYGPDSDVTRLFYDAGGLKCLIEYFYTHSLEALSPGAYRMHGLLYEDEQLELGVRNEDGQTGIRIGPMFLERRRLPSDSDGGKDGP
jgi:D-alanyl-D-alanine dipeptidase